VSERNETQLQSNALGLLATAALTAAYMGPAMSIYALYGSMSEIVGTGMGFVMFIGMLMTLPSAISFGLLASEMPSAGGVYAWSRAALGESLGLWIGLTTAAYYIVCVIFPPIVFGQYFNELLQQCGVQTNVWTWLLGMVLLLAITGSVIYRGIVVSAELAFTMLMIEWIVVIVLAATFIGFAIYHHTFTWAPFTLGGCKAGWSSVFLALPMALLSMACDGATPAAEETRNAKRTIPIAVVLTCTLVGLWYVVGYSAFALAGPVVAGSDSFSSAVTPLAGLVWGPFKLLVSITAMTAAAGATIPGAIAASRVLFSMSRDDKLPRGLSRLHARFLSPWNALNVVFGVAILAALPVTFLYGPLRAIEFWGGVSGWFIAAVYVSANVSCIVYFWRFRRAKFHVIWHLIVPLIGILAQVLVIWRSIIIELWDQGGLGHCAQLLIVLVSVACAIYVFVFRARNPASADVPSNKPQ
jgi:amino acid transporter